MKRETRANLIFLAIFVGICAPGAVILFKRKLDPRAAPMYLPDPVRLRLPYMAPQWTPEEVVRVIPVVTGQWVDQINREQDGGPEVLMRDRLPVLSNDRMLQVTAVKRGARVTSIYLIAWDGEYGDDARHFEASILAGGKTYRGRVRAARKMAVPETVRQELLNAGYVKPRSWVSWVELEFDGIPAEKQALVLQVSYREGVTSASGSVNLFTE